MAGDRAREIAEQVAVELALWAGKSLHKIDDPQRTFFDVIEEKIAAALTSYRNEGLEEAAKVAGQFGDQARQHTYPWSTEQAVRTAAAIRALKVEG